MSSSAAQPMLSYEYAYVHGSVRVVRVTLSVDLHTASSALDYYPPETAVYSFSEVLFSTD